MTTIEPWVCDNAPHMQCCDTCGACDDRVRADVFCRLLHGIRCSRTVGAQSYVDVIAHYNKMPGYSAKITADGNMEIRIPDGGTTVVTPVPPLSSRDPTPRDAFEAVEDTTE